MVDFEAQPAKMKKKNKKRPSDANNENEEPPSKTFKKDTHRKNRVSQKYLKAFVCRSYQKNI